MKKFLLILLAALALQSSLTAMQPDQNERRVVQLNPEWRTENQVPDKVTILEFDEPITDELLLQLNPEWIALKKSLTREQKSKILAEAAFYIPGDPSIKRCLMALSICIGADPDSSKYGNSNSALWHSSFRQDYQFAKYILAKGANPNLKNTSLNCTSLAHVKNVALAELFISYGAQLSEESALKDCANEDYPAELLQFYLDKGIKIKTTMGISWTHLHDIASGPDDENQVKKTQLLLNAGLDQTIKNTWDLIALHTAAIHKRKKICTTLVNHYLEQHKRFLTLLWCLKKQFPYFYGHRDAKRLLFGQGFSDAMPKLRELLKITTRKGQTAYELLPIPELDPNTCTYEKYLKLKNTPSNL